MIIPTNICYPSELTRIQWRYESEHQPLLFSRVPVHSVPKIMSMFRHIVWFNRLIKPWQTNTGTIATTTAEVTGSGSKRPLPVMGQCGLRNARPRRRIPDEAAYVSILTLIHRETTWTNHLPDCSISERV